MYFERIILLLSNHRNEKRPELPTTLSKTQIIALIGASLSPDRPQDELTKTITEALKELEAQGEINANADSKNRYCIALPTVLAPTKNNLTKLLFRGDRAYLSLTHQVLNTEQEPTKALIRTNINDFDVIKNKLSQVGITLLTVEQSIEFLPVPELPTKAILRSPYSLNPFDNSVRQYFPQDDLHTQSERWLKITESQLTNENLLQLVTKKYLWFEDNKFYELEQGREILTMFALDKAKKHPLLIEWNKPQGRLNLQGIFLPSDYYGWLCSLSKPIDDGSRIHCIKPINQPWVESAFKRLGCRLV